MSDEQVGADRITLWRYRRIPGDPWKQEPRFAGDEADVERREFVLAPTADDGESCGWCHGEGAIRDEAGKLGEDCPRCKGRTTLADDDGDEGGAAGCPFCDYAGPSPVLAHDGSVFLIEPLDPVCEGHLLVVPVRHLDHFAQHPHLTGRVALFAAEYIRRNHPDRDYNLITSKGVVATQTVPHLHFHLIPRREGDGLMLPWSSSIPTEKVREE